MAAKNRRKQQQPSTTTTTTTNGSQHNVAENNGNHEFANNIHNNPNHDYHEPELPDNVDDNSPLKLFGEAKDKINRLYDDIDQCIGKACKFYTETQLDSDVIQESEKDRLRQLNKSIETIRTVLSRNQMKVAFFGKTSNGKSTVINAILRHEVLPMSYGHTTGCFLQIQGSRENEGFLEVQKNGQGQGKMPIQSVADIANATNPDSLDYSTLVKIYWPISKCPLLKYDVVLVDSPGIDVEGDLDDCIDEYCHDADVFVLVSNAECTLNNVEKNFFHKVSEKLSKPNIFILNNKWDTVVQYDRGSMNRVRQQHVERAINFLSKELKISSQEEAKQRSFFVSGRETLESRSPTAVNFSHDSMNKIHGHEERTREFLNFEKTFEESLSKSAVNTKFKKHTDKGKETINELTQILRNTQVRVIKVSENKLLELQENQDLCKSISNLFYANEGGLQEQIREIRKRIQIVADSEFENEIRRLSRIVEDFDMQFSPSFDKIMFYKEHLYMHVERCLSEDLRTRVTTVINKHVNPFNKVMCEISQLLSKERQERIKTILASQVYIQDELFDLRIYKQFYTEFQEDLEFRFSLGLVSIIRKFQAKFGGKSSHPTTSLNASQDNSPLMSTSMSANTDFLSILERFMMNPPQSPTTVGSLAVGGILVRTVGWKVIVVTTVVYGALYAYEYLTWTNSAKERTFKAQYVRFARKGLMDCVPIISQHIANSVEQKMMLTFSRVKKEVDSENSEASSKINLLRSSLEKLQLCEDFTRNLTAQNDVLLTELLAFATSFLTNY